MDNSEKAILTILAALIFAALTAPIYNPEILQLSDDWLRWR